MTVLTKPWIEGLIERMTEFVERSFSVSMAIWDEVDLQHSRSGEETPTWRERMREAGVRRERESRLETLAAQRLWTYIEQVHAEGHKFNFNELIGQLEWSPPESTSEHLLLPKTARDLLDVKSLMRFALSYRQLRSEASEASTPEVHLNQSDAELLCRLDRGQPRRGMHRVFVEQWASRRGIGIDVDE